LPARHAFRIPRRQAPASRAIPTPQARRGPAQRWHQTWPAKTRRSCAAWSSDGSLHADAKSSHARRRLHAYSGKQCPVARASPYDQCEICIQCGEQFAALQVRLMSLTAGCAPCGATDPPYRARRSFHQLLTPSPRHQPSHAIGRQRKTQANVLTSAESHATLSCEIMSAASHDMEFKSVPPSGSPAGYPAVLIFANNNPNGNTEPTLQ
jgi:hypothetical protein